MKFSKWPKRELIQGRAFQDMVGIRVDGGKEYKKMDALYFARFSRHWFYFYLLKTYFYITMTKTNSVKLQFVFHFSDFLVCVFYRFRNVLLHRIHGIFNDYEEKKSMASQENKI